MQELAVNLLDYSAVMSRLKEVSVLPCADFGDQGQSEADVLGDRNDDVPAITFDELSTPVSSLFGTGRQRTFLALLTHFGDLTSFEYVQRLVGNLSQLEASGARVIVVGIGSPANARAFCAETSFPVEYVYADPDAACYRALGMYQGFARDVNGVNPYAKLLAMLAGIGSPGTLQAVLRGYIGDRRKKIDTWAAQVIRLVDPELFNILGKDYSRPFELATVRLQNMISIIPRWNDLAPVDTPELLTQQGGTLVFDCAEARVLFAHRDSGILCYADVEEAVAAALQPARLKPAASDIALHD